MVKSLIQTTSVFLLRKVSAQFRRNSVVVVVIVIEHFHDNDNDNDNNNNNDDDNDRETLVSASQDRGGWRSTLSLQVRSP